MLNNLLLDKSKSKLNSLVGEAMEKNIPLAQFSELVKQSQKVDDLILKSQRKLERQKRSKTISIFNSR